MNPVNPKCLMNKLWNDSRYSTLWLQRQRRESVLKPDSFVLKHIVLNLNLTLDTSIPLGLEGVRHRECCRIKT